MLTWFFSRPCLQSLLDRWRSVPSNFDPDQPIDPTWNVDSLELPLGPAETPGLFEAAVDLLFHYRIYPESVLVAQADFLSENRLPRAGDRIVQRIRVLPGLMDAIAMNIVTTVWHEPDRRGFSMRTSELHYEMGEWTASIARRPGGPVRLLVHSISRPGPRLPPIMYPLARRLQVAAQRSASDHFKLLLANGHMR